MFTTKVCVILPNLFYQPTCELTHYSPPPLSGGLLRSSDCAIQHNAMQKLASLSKRQPRSLPVQTSKRDGLQREPTATLPDRVVIWHCYGHVPTGLDAAASQSRPFKCLRFSIFSTLDETSIITSVTSCYKTKLRTMCVRRDAN